MLATPAPPRLALVGDRSASVRAHSKIPLLIEVLGGGHGDPIEPYWLHSAAITGPDDIAGFDGVWVMPGSPYANPAGILAAIAQARTAGIPLLGTCGGFQHLLLEFAHNVCGLTGVGNAEEVPEATELLIVPLRCSLLGEEATITIAPATAAARAMGEGRSSERFFCRYGLNPAYTEVLRDHGLVFSGCDDTGDPRVVELPGHPFFIGSLFQPELSSDPTWVHPLIAAFATAIRDHAQRGPEADLPVDRRVPVAGGQAAVGQARVG
ncbi:MAG: hypothetical protein M3N98_08460 [Actinomycetota bacterium]|nr:hypothetical protein [Actinomycetota bacterium]